MNELTFTMLGRRGVGKTSMLAAMYATIENALDDTLIVFGKNAETSAELDTRLRELRSMAQEQVVMVGNGIKGGREMREFSFYLGKKGCSPEVTVKFYDFPGGWLDDGPKRREVEDLCKKSHAIIIPIDAPPLMEEEAKYNDEVNHPRAILSVLRNTLQDLKAPRLVILAPIRCEKYMRTKKHSKELLSRVKAEYSPVIKLFGAPALKDYVTLVVTPVQTIGCVVFSYFSQVDRGELLMHFRKIKVDAKYAPVDCDQPMRHLLAFLLRLHLDRKKWPWPFDYLRRLFVNDEDFKEAAERLASGAKNGSESSQAGFEVIQRPEI